MARTAILKGIEHLHGCDPKLSKIIERAGPCTLKRESNHFWMLVRSILSQQISTSAATTIRNRVDELMKQERSADSLALLTDEQLRSAGVSKQKISYLRSLTDKVLSNKVCLKTISKCSNEEITQQLIQIKGIGVWTADMFLIFSLGRLDVFPIGDGGVKAAMRKIYKLSEDAPTTQYHKIAAKWQPYATVGSWYCWRALELKND